MAVIKIDQFKGMAPKIEPRMLPAGAAQVATNVVFGSGSLRPLAEPLSVVAAGSASLQSGTISSLFKYGANWLTWNGGQDVNVCRSAVALDNYDRLYWTGDTASPVGPKMADSATIIGGAGTKPNAAYKLGIPKPVNYLWPTIETPPVDPNAENRKYAYCFRSLYGEEGPLSDISRIITVDPGVTVELHMHKPSGVEPSPGEVDTVSPSGSNITHLVIYRANTGSSTTVWQYVTAVAIGTIHYSDSILSADLGEVCPSETWIAPPVTLQGLVSHPGGFLVGFYNTANGRSVVCVSEAYMPHAWPASYQMVIDVPIVALGVFGNNILVVTTGMPYLVMGNIPGQLSPPEKMERGEACLSKRSFVDLGFSCAWAGPSGLWLASTGSVILATEGIFKPEEWRALLVAVGAASGVGLMGAQYGSTYIGFGPTGTFVFDAATGDYSTTDVAATAHYYDQTNGTLYLVVAGAIVSWNAGATKKQMVWKSRPERLVSPDNMGVLQLFSDSYSPAPTVKIYADGVQITHKGSPYTISVTSSEPVPLPGGHTVLDTYEVEVTSTTTIVPPILLASCLSELGG
ncbi:MAG: hypothetical protein ACOYL3_07050 [Desulfuromonadaceae bacterium]